MAGSLATSFPFIGPDDPFLLINFLALMGITYVPAISMALIGH
jgi:hypothetical protein